MAARTRKRLIAIATGALVGVILLPLLSVSIVAFAEAVHLEGRDDYSTSRLLLDAVRVGHSEGQGMASMSMQQQLVDCDVDTTALPDWLDGPNHFWAAWGPQQSYTIASMLLSEAIGQRSGTPAIRADYINTHTSPFERRFLLGCMTATVVARLCERQVEAMIDQADAQPPSDYFRQLSIEQNHWVDRTLCALATALAKMEKPSKK